MAEVVGLASGIASLITIAAQITKISYSLIADFKNAPHSQELFLIEILSLKDVILQAQKSCEDAKAAGLPIRCPDTLSDSTLTECRNRLLSIEDELRAGMSRAIWLLKEKHFRKQAEALRQFRDVFGALVSANALTTASETYKQVKSLSAENDRTKLLRWLEQTEETSAALPSPSPGTGGFFLRTQQYLDWSAPGGRPVLWCTGAPGSGKSSLASIAVRDLLSQSENSPTIVAYYFCDFAAQQQQDVAAILQSLLRQVVTNVDVHILPDLVQLQAKARQAGDVHILSTMLNTVCRQALRLSVVFDAPDELANPAPILSIFRDLATEGAKVLITSRNMGTNLANYLSDAAHLRIEADTVDIVRFVELKLHDTDVYGNGQGIHDLATTIADKANGIFLLARILVDDILQMTTIKKMRKALEAVPTHLNQAYSSTLRRIESQPRGRRQLAQQALLWITHARRRLRIEELQHALALDDDDDDLDEENIPSIEVLIKICAGLVIATDDGRVGMVHTTAYEFFRRHFDTGAHGQIGKASLRYLKLRPLQAGSCKSIDEMDARLIKMPFVSYAATYWADHILEDPEESMAQENLHEILTNPNFISMAFQAIQYDRRFDDRGLTEEFFKSIPHNQGALHLAAYWRLPNTLEVLLRAKPDLHLRDSQGWTPLHWACCRSSSSAIRLLVAAGASVNEQDSQGWTPLFWCALNADLDNVEYLLQNGARFVTKDIHGWTALTWATVSASPERYTVVERLLDHYQQGSNVDMIEPDDSPLDLLPLDLADARGDSDLFKALLAHRQQLHDSLETLWSTGKLDVPVSNVWRTLHKGEKIYGVGHELGMSSMLSRSIRDGKRTIMRVLLELGALPSSVKTDSTRSPLHWAAYRRDPQFVQDLINAGADVACLDQFGQTALHQAVLNGFVETTKVLIEAGSDVNLRRPSLLGQGETGIHPEQTPLMLACGLASDRYKSSVRGPSATEMVTLLLANGADPHAKDGINQSVMHYAIMSGKSDIVRLLLSAGATFEGQSDRGTTLLHAAAKAWDTNILDLVVDSNPDMKAIDDLGQNVFHFLARRPRYPVLPTDRLETLVDTLLARCGDGMLSAICQKQGHNTLGIAHGDHIDGVATPLSLAFDQGSWPLARIFHERGAILPQSFPTGTWLVPAISQCSIVGVRLLLQLGVLPGEVIWHSFPALQGEPSSENLITCGNIVKDLVAAGLNINEPMDASYSRPEQDHIYRANYATILSTAASRVNDEQFIQLLLDLGADPRIPDESNMDSFRIAALCMHWDTLTTLLRHVAVHSAYSAHWTFAARSFSDDESVTKLCKALQQHGEIDRVWGQRTLLIMASLRGNLRLIAALLSNGADPNFSEEITGFTALHHAAFAGHLEIIDTLLDTGAKIDTRTSKWHNGSEKPIGLNEGNVWEGTALHLAAMKGRLDIVTTLIARGADIHAETGVYLQRDIPSQGPTALHLTLSTGIFYSSDRKPDLCAERLQIAKLLIARGAGLNGVTDRMTSDDAKKFAGYEELWETLRNGNHGRWMPTDGVLARRTRRRSTGIKSTCTLV